jgi:hypothetical protein
MMLKLTCCRTSHRQKQLFSVFGGTEQASVDAWRARMSHVTYQ